MKLKLNIQYFGSTNKTSHYELSQYVGSDKPTYLVDYNSDMSKIDAGIYSAESKATINEGSIGDLTTLSTTNKTDLVSAINEVNTQVGTNTGDISTLNTSVSANTGNIGVMANLETTDKTNLVNAINELKGVNDTQNTNISNNTARIENFNLTHFDDLTFTTQNGTITANSMRIAYNDDGSLCKIYGTLAIGGYAGTISDNKATASSPLRPETDITINGFTRLIQDNNGGVVGSNECSITIKTDGTIELPMALTVSNNGSRVRHIYAPVLIFVKDFGDVPTPQI